MLSFGIQAFKALKTPAFIIAPLFCCLQGNCYRDFPVYSFTHSRARQPCLLGYAFLKMPEQ